MSLQPGRVRPQTAKQAKANFKKHGPRLSDREIRVIERSIIEQDRADQAKQKEKRRQTADRKKKEKKAREQEARERLGIGKATQLVGYSHTQKRLKTGMETFLRCGKTVVSDKAKDTNEAIEALLEESAQKGWDVDAKAEQHSNEDEYWGLDIIDDATLLEAEEQASSEPWALHDDTIWDLIDFGLSAEVSRNNSENPVVEHRKRMRPLSPGLDRQAQYTTNRLSQLESDHRPNPVVPLLHNPLKTPPNLPEEPSLVQLHGPLDKPIERLLDTHPGPIIELLSEDVSSNKSVWDPTPALLYKLKPPDLPLHRLRLKVGCTVALLRDLNSSSQISKSRHLGILAITKERLDCVVLDGHLVNTKTFITKIVFTAQYKNEARYSYSRMQFPVKVVSFGRSCSAITHGMGHSNGGIATSAHNVSGCVNVNKNQAQSALPTPASARRTGSPVDWDVWGEFLASGTQITRELSAETVVSPTRLPTRSSASNLEFTFCTQDLDLSAEDLDELESSVDGNPGTRETFLQSTKDAFLMPPPQRPVLASTKSHGRTRRTSPKSQNALRSKSDGLHLDPYLKELGISTQDVVSLLDEDTIVFSQHTLV